MPSTARTVLGDTLRWFCNATIIVVALGMFARKYGFEEGTLWLVGMGTLAGLLLAFHRMQSIYPGLLTMLILGVMSLVGLAIDRMTGGYLFALKHSHFDGLLGVPWIEDRKSDGVTLHIFQDGFKDTWTYAVRSDRSWFPQMSILPDSWSSGDPLPEKMTWETMTR